MSVRRSFLVRSVRMGKMIYCELDQTVVSKKRLFRVGDKVRVRVSRDVVVDGAVVIPEGAPVEAEVSFLKTSRIWGEGATLEISATAVRLGDGREIPLRGSYGKLGKDRNELTSTDILALSFIKGKKAVIEAGTQFVAYTGRSFTKGSEG